MEDPARIPILKRGEVVAHALVDAADVALVSRYRWHPATNGYALSHNVSDEGPKTLYMHRLILGVLESELHVDHINGDPLDNRRSNLRAVTRSQNLQNRRGATRTSTSRYRGVSWHKGAQKWVVQVKVDGRGCYLGTYMDELEAARVAARFRAEHMTHTIEDPAMLRAA